MTHLLEDNMTHKESTSCLKSSYCKAKQRILERGNLSNATIQEQLNILTELIQFPLGQHILKSKGANGYWTDYMVSNPYVDKRNSQNNIENFLLNRSLHVKAQQEVFRIFKKTAQSYIREGVNFASIPCGLMRDLLCLDYSGIENFTLIGVDIDGKSLKLAQNLSKQYRLENHVNFFRQSAWALTIQEEFDLINSIGLNVYASNRQEVIQLYKVLRAALKNNGVLITAVLTYPPNHDKLSNWNISNINSQDLELEMLLHGDILNLNWQNFRTEDEIENDFLNAGFSKIEIIYDINRIFPTVIAYK